MAQSRQQRRLMELEPHERWRRIGWSVSRILLVWAVIAVGYYYLPLEDIGGRHPVWLVGVALTMFFAVFAYTTYRVFIADLPQLRAIEAVGFTVPFFLTMFAVLYLVLGREGQSFSQHLDRITALYFTVTVFATVGFGDITPTSQTTELLVSLQMLLDLVVLGVVVKVIFGAARRGLESSGEEPGE